MQDAAPQILFEVFGDESVSGELVAYGVVIVPSVKPAEVEAAVAKAKIAFGASSAARIHCKTLLHGDPRSHSEWPHLSADKAFSLIESVAESATAAGARVWIGFLDSRTAPERMLFEGDGKVVEQQITDLHLLQFAYWAAMGPVMDFIPHKNIRGWMDPNNERIKWLG